MGLATQNFGATLKHFFQRPCKKLRSDPTFGTICSGGGSDDLTGEDEYPE